MSTKKRGSRAVVEDVVHITGHKNPDTSPVVLAITYAQLKQKLGTNVTVCRLGELNPGTNFVLKGSQVPEPVYIQDARVKLYDVPFGESLLLKKDGMIKEAWDRMGMCSTSVLFAVGEAQKLVGVVSLPDMINTLMNDEGEKPISLMKNTSYGNIRKVLQDEFLYECGAYRTNGKIHVLCGRNEEYSDTSHRDSIVVADDDLKLQKRALSDRAGCMVLVDMDIIPQGTIRMARETNRTIIKTLPNMFQAACSMYCSPSVGLAMERKTVNFNNHAYIDDVYKQMSKSRPRSYPVVSNQDVALGSISRYHLLSYQKKKFILVDHNELPQSIDDPKEAEVPEAVDHHRIDDVEMTTPTRSHNEIIGNTVPTIARIYKETDLVPKIKAVATMCRTIISDTMNFNSSTTTSIDKELARELAVIAGTELDAVAEEMFGAVATVKGKATPEILYNDFKEYNIDGKRIAVGQINIADEQEIANIQDEIRAYTEGINEINRSDLFMAYSTAAGGSGSNLVFIGTLNYFVNEAPKEDIMDELYFMGGVISRKKQIISILSKCLESMWECGKASF